MQKPIVLFVHLVNTNIKLEQTNVIHCPAGTMRATHDNDDDPFWMVQTNNNVADAKADCIVCPSGQYQHQTQQTTCIDCPAGTARATHDNDDDPWDGGTNNNVADAEADCIVCPPGEYQHQTQQTTCIDCPAGTVRYSDNVDGNSWNGATNNDIADTKADCKVCPSGRYQNQGWNN